MVLTPEQRQLIERCARDADSAAELTALFEAQAIQNNHLLESLQIREAQDRTIVDAQSELITRFRPDLTITFVNEAYCRFTGKTANEIIGSNLLSLVLPERYHSVKQDYEDYIKNPRKVFNEHTARRYDEALRWMQWVREPIFNAQGDLIEIQTVGRDITDLKTAQVALSRSEERYRRFIEAAPVGVMITRETVIQYANRALVRLLRGQSADEIQGKTVFDILHPDYHDLIVDRVDRLGHDNEEELQRIEQFVCLDGSVVDVEVAITPFEFDGEPVSLTFVRDITRHKASEDSLHIFQTRLKALQQLGMHLGSQDTFDEFCREAVEQGREQLGFDRLGLWFMIDGYTVGSFGTDEYGQTTDERSLRYPLDERFPGYHFDETNFLDYVDDFDLQQSGSLKRKGWRAMTALWDGNRVIGVLSADNLINQQPASTEQLELLVLYGSTLGHLTTRWRIQARLRANEATERRFQQQLRALHEVSIDLTKATTFDNFCREAVEQGRQKLGFDRLSLWLLDADGHHVIGSFGTDEAGQTVDERAVRHALETPYGVRNDRPLVYEADTDLLNADNEKVGRGWVAGAALWDGDRIVGYVNADNLLNQQPASTEQLELLVLYGSTLGHLATRLRAQEALVHSEARYRAIYEGAGIGICVADDQGHPIAFNPVFEAMLGYDPDELRRMRFSEFTHPDYVERNLNYFEALLRNEHDHYQLVKRYIRKDRTAIWVRLNVSIFPSQAQDTKHIIAMVEDITAQKEAELQFQAGEKRRLALFEALPDLIFMLNRDGIFLDYHTPDEDELLLASEIFLNRHYAAVLPDSIVQVMQPHFEAVLATGAMQIYEYPLTRNDRTEYYETRMIAYGDDHILSIVRNVTDSRLAEEQLRESEERFRQIADNVDEVFFVRDVADDTILYINPAYEKLWEQPRTELLNDPTAFAKIIHPDDRDTVLAAMQQKHDRRFDLEYRLVRGDAEPRWMWARNFPIKDDQGEVYRIAGVVKDITERKQVEAKNLELAVQQERVNILSEFIRDASHEFRTPLSIINSKVYLAGRVEDPADRQAHLQGIQDQSDHILKLVESLVTMTRLDSQLNLEVHPVDVNSLMQAIHVRHQTQISENDIELCLETTPELPSIAGSVDELYIAIVHLINNAVAHTSTGDQITLYTGRLDAEHITLTVADTGSGIAEDELPHIFDKFYRSDEAHSTRGFGLGLPIALKVVELHGGEIEVASQPGQGSTFTIILPV